MHEAGIRHRDLHAGNLLVHLEHGADPRFFLIDLHDVRMGAPMDWPASRENLVLLNRWGVLRANRSERLRFWRAYSSVRQTSQAFDTSSDSHDDPRARELESATWESNLRFWQQRDRRCLRTNRYYRRIKKAGARGFAVQDLDRAFLDGLLEDPDQPFRQPKAGLLKNSRSSTVAEVEVPSSEGPALAIYKRFRITRWMDAVKNRVRSSEALRSWISGQGLRERCLPTPRPLAVWHRYRCGLPAEGYLLTLKIPDAVELHAFLKDLALEPAGVCRQRLRGQIEHLARLIRELHRRKLSHRDLKAANVLVSHTAPRPADALLPDAGPIPLSFGGLWLIDLVGLVAYRRLSLARRIQNLSRLNASFWQNATLTRTDRLRFLSVYLEWGLRGRPGWKTWWRAIDRATQVKIAHNRKTGRPLA
jgi:hypothetical protein